MGASFSAALRRARPGLSVVGVDREEAAVARAVDRGLVEAGSADLGLALGADAVFVAVPLGALGDVLPALAGFPGIVTDMASVKGPVLELAAAAGVDLVGGHPMCGREVSGIEAADPSLFENAAWVLTREDPAIAGLVRAVGAHPLVLDAQTHDRLVAGISHAAFLVSVGYLLAMTTAPDWPAMSPLASSGFRDVTRLASGDPDLYGSLALANRDALLPRLDAVIDQLGRLRRNLERSDGRLVELMEEAKAARDRWLRERGARAGQG